MKNFHNDYVKRLNTALASEAMHAASHLAHQLNELWERGGQLFICGNGGSAGNAIHLANDFIYGAGLRRGKGLKVEALSANSAVITCLANDVGYDKVFSEQLKVKGNPGDILLVLSGSGNSPNVIAALEAANELGLITFAILGYSGGRCKGIVQYPIHFQVNDMQIAEDLQLIVGHMCMQWLCTQY